MAIVIAEKVAGTDSKGLVVAFNSSSLHHSLQMKTIASRLPSVGAAYFRGAKVKSHQQNTQPVLKVFVLLLVVAFLEQKLVHFADKGVNASVTICYSN